MLAVQAAIEAYLEGVGKDHPFKVMVKEANFVKQLATCMIERVLDPGELLITKGQPGEEMFFITGGEAHVLL